MWLAHITASSLHFEFRPLVALPLSRPAVRVGMRCHTARRVCPSAAVCIGVYAQAIATATATSYCLLLFGLSAVRGPHTSTQPNTAARVRRARGSNLFFLYLSCCLVALCLWFYFHCLCLCRSLLAVGHFCFLLVVLVLKRYTTNRSVSFSPANQMTKVNECVSLPHQIQFY